MRKGKVASILYGESDRMHSEAETIWFLACDVSGYLNKENTDKTSASYKRAKAFVEGLLGRRYTGQDKDCSKAFMFGVKMFMRLRRESEAKGSITFNVGML